MGAGIVGEVLFNLGHLGASRGYTASTFLQLGCICSLFLFFPFYSPPPLFSFLLCLLGKSLPSREVTEVLDQVAMLGIGATAHSTNYEHELFCPLHISSIMKSIAH